MLNNRSFKRLVREELITKAQFVSPARCTGDDLFAETVFVSHVSRQLITQELQ